MPWANAGQGVDVEVDLSESANSPQAPIDNVANVNDASNSVTPITITPTQAATIPSVQPISASLDVNSSGALLAASAATAAEIMPKSSPLEGYGIITSNNAKIPVIGSFAQTPDNIQQGGYTKPGSAALLNSLAERGYQVPRIFTENMFTGKPGGENFNRFVTNTSAQASNQINNFQRTQSLLTKTGLISGKESASQIGGILLAGSNFGIKSTVNLFQGVGSKSASAIKGSLNSNNPVLRAISTGNNALKIVNTVGSFGGLSKSIDALQKAGSGISSIYKDKGIVASAFGAVSGTFKALTPGVPQNLRKISELNKSFGAVAGQAGTKTNLNNLVNASKSAIGGIGAQASALASGILNMPGGMAGMTNIINKLPGASSINVPGVDKLTGTITSALNSAFTGKGTPNIPKGLNGLVSAASTNLGAGDMAQLLTSITGLTGGGNQKIRPPNLGFNTVNVSGLNNQVNNLLGDPRIPSPNNIGQIQPSTVSSFQNTQSELEKNRQDIAKLNEFSKKISKARQEYETLKATLPAGDPEIQAAKEAWFKIVDDPERKAILARIDKL